MKFQRNLVRIRFKQVFIFEYYVKGLFFNLKAAKKRILAEFHQSPKPLTKVQGKIHNFVLCKCISYGNQYYWGVEISTHSLCLPIDFVKRAYTISLGDFQSPSFFEICILQIIHAVFTRFCKHVIVTGESSWTPAIPTLESNVLFVLYPTRIR